MKKRCAVLLSGVFFFCFLSSVSAGFQPKVNVITIEDAVINPVIEEYIAQGIDYSEAEQTDCLIIQLDTPGGLLQSTRAIVKDMMNAAVPVVVYVGPSGSRAGSAGVFITLASHVAAMAPSTNIGAAHPVDIGGGDPDEKRDILRSLSKFIQEKKRDVTDPALKKKENEAGVLDGKVLNDTIAWVRSLAQTRGRNESWAVEAVRESVSATETEALELGVIDIVADDVTDIIRQLNGRTVTLQNGFVKTFQLVDPEVTHIPISQRQKILLAISHPNIAYILMMLGFYGLLFEVTHPGIGFPGVAGAICLILAFYSMSTLPVNYAGLALIILGIILFIAEVNVVSYGLLAFGGIVCFSLGSLFLIDSSLPFLQISLSLILPVVIVTTLITIFLVSAVVRVHRRKSLVGKEGLLGSVGHADVDFAEGKGTVKIHGEIWHAQSVEAIRKDERVVVNDVDGLLLKVSKQKDAD